MRRLDPREHDSPQFQNPHHYATGFPHAFCASALAVQSEGVLTLQVRGERCRSERREKGREEAHPARMEGTHVRLREAADLQLGGLVLRIHCAFERPPVEITPCKGCTGLKKLRARL